MIMTQTPDQTFFQAFNAGSNSLQSGIFSKPTGAYLYNSNVAQGSQQSTNPVESHEDSSASKSSKNESIGKLAIPFFTGVYGNSENLSASTYQPYTLVYQPGSDDHSINETKKMLHATDLDEYKNDRNVPLPGFDSISSESTGVTHSLSIPIITRNDETSNDTASSTLVQQIPTNSVYDNSTTIRSSSDIETNLAYSQYSHYPTVQGANNDIQTLESQYSRFPINSYSHMLPYYCADTIGSPYQLSRSPANDQSMTPNIHSNSFAYMGYSPNGFPASTSTSMIDSHNIDASFGSSGPSTDQQAQHQMLLMSMMATGMKQPPMSVTDQRYGFSMGGIPIPRSYDGSNRTSQRYACKACIRGHRAPSCKHADRQLFPVKPRGRPSNQCPHCKEARKSSGLHVKCLCTDSRETMLSLDHISNIKSTTVDPRMYEYYMSENNRIHPHMNSRCLCNLGLPCICGGQNNINAMRSNVSNASHQ